ncbi:MAG: hypothetical protein VX875_08145 [Pseudomonadota bacterium]|nr:hypothetical protein [Pseudomonadota bacterium]
MVIKVILTQILAFMFALQSVWGVAEASCLHDNNKTTNSTITAIEYDNAKKNINTTKIETYCKKVCFQDSCGHFGHHVTLKNDLIKQQSIQFLQLDSEQLYEWKNSYQSLILTTPLPPPLIQNPKLHIIKNL